MNQNILKYKTLDHWRGMAALGVMVFHSFGAVRSAGLSVHPSIAWLKWLSDFGWFGVQLFFVISGYCIAANVYPRCEIESSSDEIIRARVESPGGGAVFEQLEANDILFIDSSHELKVGNDVVWLFLNILPALRPGVLVHVHDIFLPYEYPGEWVINLRWEMNEQYLVQALVDGGNSYDVLWAGHYCQRTNPAFKDWFAHWRGVGAKSLWLRKR